MHSHVTNHPVANVGDFCYELHSPKGKPPLLQECPLIDWFPDDVFGAITKEMLVPLVHYMQRHTKLNVWLNQQLYFHNSSTGELEYVICNDLLCSDQMLDSVQKQ